MADELLTWSVQPIEGYPVKRLAIFGVAFAAMAIGWFGFGKPLFGLIGFAMILGSTADSWLGTTFRLDAKGASARIGPSITAMEWSEVRRVLERGTEIRLSPLERASDLDAFRGVGLVTREDNREAVLNFVHAHVPVASRPSSTSEAAKDETVEIG